MKKLISMLLIIGIILSSSVLAKTDSAKLETNNQEVISHVEARVVEGQILLPLREIFEYLGLEVSWDGTTRTVTGENKDILIKFAIDDVIARVNGKVVKLDNPAVIIDQRTMVAPKFIEEITGGKVSWDEDTNVLFLKIKDKDLEDIESIIEYGTNGLVGAHYPVFGKSKIDGINRELVTEYIKDFKNELANNSYDNKDFKYELSIDYETYRGPDNIVSISFDIMESSSYLAHPDIKIETRVYDLSNDKEVELDNIMNGEYLKYISQLSENYFSKSEIYGDNIDSSIFEEGIYPSKDNYSNFLFKEDKIVFIFEKYQLFSGNFGMPSIEIDYLDLKDYIKPELMEVLTEEESHDDKIEIDIDKPIVEVILPERVVDPSKPMIALTFDDGPNKKTTIPILDTLKEYDSVATFFVLGNRVPNNAEILKRMLEEGSEIGNHTYNHKELTKLSSPELQKQIKNTQDAIENATNIEAKFMRPTYGSFNNNVKSQVKMPLILWSVDTLDWKSRDSKKVKNHVLANVKDGDIILMHDIYDSTAEAVKLLVPELIDMGYQLVTISELFESRGETLKDGQVYFQMQKK